MRRKNDRVYVAVALRKQHRDTAADPILATVATRSHQDTLNDMTSRLVNEEFIAVLMAVYHDSTVLYLCCFDDAWSDKIGPYMPLIAKYWDRIDASAEDTGMALLSEPNTESIWQ